MTIQKNLFGLVDFRGKKGGAAAVGMHSFHQPSMGLANFARPGIRTKPQHLIGLLLAHGARARRSNLPRTKIAVSLFTKPYSEERLRGLVFGTPRGVN